MKKLCITTIVSPDDFQFFLPLFTYCAQRAYPEAVIKTFVCGKLDPDSRPFIQGEVYEDMFTDYKIGPSTFNALRQLIPAKYFEGCNYLYPTDADFLMFRQKTPHVEYYADIMHRTGLPIACARGPLKGLKTTRMPGGWTEHRTRIAAGCLMLKIPDWFNATKKARRYYREVVKSQLRDRYDKLPACSYREYDEVMIYRICRMSKIRTPEWKDHFINKEKMSAVYRDIHLGDFKFKGRYHNVDKMKRILRRRNVRNYLKLQDDPEWYRITQYVSGKSKPIRRVLNKLERYVKERLMQG